jgi:TatD DNase family protein
LLTDTHCHLHLRQFDLDRDEVVARAEANGVTKIIEVGIDLESNKEAIALAARYQQVYAAVGIHPYEAEKVTQEVWAELRSLASQPGVVAIRKGSLWDRRDRLGLLPLPFAPQKAEGSPEEATILG